MARILICHVPKDGSLARDLGSALMGRGHFVSFDGEPDAERADRLSRLRQFEAVAVLWTEGSSQSAGLADIAREAMPLNLLVPVRVDDLALARLPLMFRKLHMLSPRDTDGIARVVARLSIAAVSLREMAEREAQRKSTAAALASPPRRADRPPPLPSPSLSATEPMVPGPGSRPQRWPDDPVVAPAAARVRPLADLPEVDAPAATPPAAARPARTRPAGARPPGTGREPPSPVSRRSGSDAERASKPAPAVMTAGDFSLAVEAGILQPRIPASMWLGTPATVELELARDVLASFAGGQSIETLSVSLYSSAEAFEIERQSERTQFIGVKYDDPARDPATQGRWAWLVTPRAVGEQELIVRVSALLRDRNGVPGPVAVPDRRYTIGIELPKGQNLISALAGWRPR
jgi:hypothetical protein